MNIKERMLSMPENKDADLNKIKELIEIMKENDLIEVEIIDGENKICLKRPSPVQSVVAAAPMAAPTAAPSTPQDAPQTEVDDGLIDIPSPLVGTFYRAASPDSDSYIEISSSVSPDSVVCIIEAMKVMNEIKAEVSGTIEKIMVENGQAVEFGQVLFKVRPN